MVKEERRKGFFDANDRAGFEHATGDAEDLSAADALHNLFLSSRVRCLASPPTSPAVRWRLALCNFSRYRVEISASKITDQ